MTTKPSPKSWTNLNSSIKICNHTIPGCPPYSPEVTATFATAMTLIMLFTIFGNILVIIGVLTCRSLRGPQNLFLVSLAAADILVATLVIPFSLANELMGYWYFSSVWCEIILALDVLFCTSSIMHLCAISLDRYLSISRPLQYASQRIPCKIKGAIVVVWLIAAVISFPPLVSMKKTQKDEPKNGTYPECKLNEEAWYILYSSIGSFFAPCIIMILVYVRIYQIAKKRTRYPPGEPRQDIVVAVPQGIQEKALQNGKEQESVGQANAPNLAVRSSALLASRSQMSPSQPSLPPVESSQQKKHSRRNKDNNNEDSSSSGSDVDVMGVHNANGTSSNVGALEPGHQTSSVTQTYKDMIATAKGSQLTSSNMKPVGTPNTRRKAMIVREKRFTFVLAVVIGGFVICWFPFFFSYSLQAICPETCKLPVPLFKFFFWIGYCNSALNPLIYTIFNRDFRKAFKKILSKRCKECSL
ncbi:alpha-2B adrenergic receptor-like [Myxocyprinus asiaticus]|uniref:alpha-2B adrenergic receptor-like n=1 Tax=Myxocyprinus asiaticus TaxID=70543 RepID=UPI0022235B76|nr:alpha-2B adrenergic receptor-like [Myxocyprinus asiaticus]